MRLVPLACRSYDRRLYLESPFLYCAVLFIVLLQNNNNKGTINEKIVRVRTIVVKTIGQLRVPSQKGLGTMRTIDGTTTKGRELMAEDNKAS
jgi:hypothetical protein